MFFHAGITPHLLQPVKLPGIGLHHVHDHIDIVDQHPLKRLKSFVVVGIFAATILYRLFNIFGDCFHLGLVTCLADNEKIGYRLMNLAEIEGNNILTLLVLDRRNYGFDDFGAFGQPRRTCSFPVSQ